MNSKVFLLVLVFFQVIFTLITFLDVPILRQIVGFLYITFIPGLIIAKLLNLKNLDRLETILFSVGLSVVFLMLAGLITNEFLILLGVSEPLALTPVILFLNGFTLVGGISVYLRSNDVKFWGSGDSLLNPLGLLFLVLPIFSVVGAMWVRIYADNLFLLFMIIAVASIIAIGVLSKKILPPKLYPFVIFSIALALVLHSTLVTQYICGYDQPWEYYVFEITRESNHWDRTFSAPDLTYGRFYSSLSITVLPTIYSNVLNINSTMVLKLVFPIILALLPVALYKMWQTVLSKKTAFIAAILFISQETFYMEVTGLARQIVAELLFVLLFLMLLRRFNSTGSRICFILLSIGLVMSHYSIAILFLFFIVVAFAYNYYTNKKFSNPTLSLCIFFFVIMFSWFIYTSSSASFESILWSVNRIFGSLGEFFDPSSRGSTVLRGLGLEKVDSPLSLLSRTFAYATEFFIMVGFIAAILKLRKTKHARPLSRKYLIFSSIAVGLLAMAIVVPRLASTLNMTRFYHILLFFLAPFFVLGCKAFIKYFLGRKTQLSVLLIAIIVVPYFLFQTNFVYEVNGSESWSIPLSKYRMDPLSLSYRGVIDGLSVFGTQWLVEYVDVENAKIYSDGLSRDRELRSYGGLQHNKINVLSNRTILQNSAVVYLSTLNVVHEKFIGRLFVSNTSDLDHILNDLNKIYTNGGSEIYITADK